MGHEWSVTSVYHIVLVEIRNPLGDVTSDGDDLLHVCRVVLRLLATAEVAFVHSILCTQLTSLHLVLNVLI